MGFFPRYYLEIILAFSYRVQLFDFWVDGENLVKAQMGDIEGGVKPSRHYAQIWPLIFSMFLIVHIYNDNKIVSEDIIVIWDTPKKLNC